MALLNREALLKKQALEITKVDLGDGDFVFVRQMTGRERDRFEASILQDVRDEAGKVVDVTQNLEDFRAKLAVYTLCDENGENIMEPGDYETLSQNIKASRLHKIVEVAQRLNRITEQDQKDMVKNLKKGREGGSSSGWHKH